MRNQGNIENLEHHLSGIEGLDILKESIDSIPGISIKEILSTKEGKEKFEIKKLILAGPPKSGKSCMREALKQSIKQIPNHPYPYVITACPDGEGAWFQESMNNNPELAQKLKIEYKSKFTPEFVKRISHSISNLSLPHNPLNFIDIGGVISDENEQICKDGNGAILICGETAVIANEPAKWKEFFNQLNIPIIAEIYSDYLGAEDYVEGVGDDGVFRGSIHHLERGEKLSDRDTVKSLAEFVINFDK
jgi:CRISPR-associated protein Csx3